VAFDFAELERLEAERPKPPPVLYKYMNDQRLDVLKCGRIRFTPPLNANDIFEVRQTFDLLAGPKMQEFFREASTDVDFDESLRRALDDSDWDSFPSIRQKHWFQ